MKRFLLLPLRVVGPFVPVRHLFQFCRASGPARTRWRSRLPCDGYRVHVAVMARALCFIVVTPVVLVALPMVGIDSPATTTAQSRTTLMPVATPTGPFFIIDTYPA